MESKEQVVTRMREDILLRGLSQNTLDSYTIKVRVFLNFCNRPINQLDEQDIRKFLWYLIKEKWAKPGTVNTYSLQSRNL